MKPIDFFNFLKEKEGKEIPLRVKIRELGDNWYKKYKGYIHEGYLNLVTLNLKNYQIN